MTLAQAGYSKKPLEAKLGFKDGMVAGFIALPEDLSALKSSVQFDLIETFSEWSTVKNIQQKFDVIHAFTMSASEIEQRLESLQSAIKRDGMIWVSWPKKASKVATDVTEDVIRNKALTIDLVDIDACLFFLRLRQGNDPVLALDRGDVGPAKEATTTAGCGQGGLRPADRAFHKRPGDHEDNEDRGDKKHSEFGNPEDICAF